MHESDLSNRKIKERKTKTAAQTERGGGQEV